MKLSRGVYYAGVGEAARELGMSRFHLTRLLHGTRTTTPGRAGEIERVTGVRVATTPPRRRAAKAKKEAGHA